ncbi:uncharacterized protein LOC102624835 [Citrus sinensis]|uniref:uncharacterized protein LOC102624835 n=1 Tax=Citrus sinensis TaxID=2711 RepID=UPI0003D77FCD|nr:uncharacterized protein LOC102624835 [Citrus sinensis]XP_052290311.1 uncharacterized protein LOC102624835 [Citrus sinensis]XP_052290321.1 uncharacterized protein LOC102624835 [Citrus sinensis]
MAMEVDKLDLNERYSKALKACHDAAFYLSHNFHDFSGTSTVQAKVERLRGEVRLGQYREKKLGEEVRALQRRLDDHTPENSRMSKKLEEVESKHVELLSRQQEMIDTTFTLIMAEVWSVDPELVVPQVDKWVDKSAILKAIEDKGVIQASPSLSPQRTSGVPQVDLPIDLIWQAIEFIAYN